ncbi:hypothetical protein Dac01nite_21020 [Demequina activiva]|uniref:DUF3152 domain-containing protein n=2 Tax=Demequina activiva TaxID=1582364 RepID=A0A919Q329_9MICO|nr:hypothetical protein Dac01nite_21020 [Demequina activiva]
MFARRGTGGPGLRAVVLVILVAFVAGIAMGWGTGLIGEQLAAPAPSPSPSSTPTPSPTPDVSVPPVEPIDRQLDEADRLAGLTSLAVPEEGEGTFTVGSTDGEPSGDAASVKWVRVEYEDGLEMNGRALSQFVLAVLNDHRGWGARGRYEFVPTSGAPDMRIVVASPTTTAATCLNPHAPASIGAAVDEETTPTPTPEPSPSEAITCADRGLIMISHYDWAAGLDAYGEDRTGSRAFQVNHGVGHLLGDEDGVCASGRALIMTDQRDLAEECEPNPWPWPDEPAPEPSETPQPTASPAAREQDAG